MKPAAPVTKTFILKPPSLVSSETPERTGPGSP